MKITVGEWRTRDGRKAIVGAQHPTGNVAYPFAGWIEQSAEHWAVDGRWFLDDPSEHDLVEPWTDTVPWDWSTTPPWINWIAMDSDGSWLMHAEEPVSGPSIWIGGENPRHMIPFSHAPKWSGDWRKSKTMRPGLNGGSK